MTDTRVGPDLPRVRRAYDLLSGEVLEIAYFPKADEITINGYSVIRSPGLTDQGGGGDRVSSGSGRQEIYRRNKKCCRALHLNSRSSPATSPTIPHLASVIRYTSAKSKDPTEAGPCFRVQLWPGPAPLAECSGEGLRGAVS